MNKKNTSTPAGQFGLFDVAASAGTSPAAVAPSETVAPTTNSGELSLRALGRDLLHLYSRYGLAVVAEQSRLPETLTETMLRTALVRAIETGLGTFRMRTWEDSRSDKVLKFEPIRLNELVNDKGIKHIQGELLADIKYAELLNTPNLISGKLTEKGFYLYPTLITTDLMAGGTFENAVSILHQLTSGKAIETKVELARSFAPTTSKLNNGKGTPTPPSGTLLEAACTLITSITPHKPAAFVKQPDAKKPSDIYNTTILPDLPLPQLRVFVEVFRQMAETETGYLMHTRERPLVTAKEGKAKVGGKEIKPALAEFRRPQLHSGNYPDAPRDAGTFGPVGLLGAIGRWARRTKEMGRGKAVLDSLAGQPLLLISYDQISQVRFDHHITRLALEEDLTGIVDSLYLGTRLYFEIDNPGTPFGKPAFKTFCLMAGRFLQSFTPTAFTDFLAFRAEYAAEVEPLFTEYFRTMKEDIVESAGKLGHWLNRTAYFAAKEDVEKFDSKKKSKEQQLKETKAKILVVLESAVLSAKTPEEMISQVLIQAGRMSLDEAPANAKRFIDATNTREITHEQAKHLLTAYMRLRGTGKNSAGPIEEVETPAATEDNYNHQAEND